MREILFKAQHPVTGEWLKFTSMIRMKNVDSGEVMLSVIPSGKIHINDGSDFDGAVEVMHNTVCQFTGQFDSNGKEIFEGDWITVNNREYFIMYIEDGFCLCQDGVEIIDVCGLYLANSQESPLCLIDRPNIFSK